MVEGGHRQFRQPITIADIDEDLLARDRLGSEQRAHERHMVLAIAISVVEDRERRIGGNAAGPQEHQHISNVLLDPVVDRLSLRALVFDALGDLIGQPLNLGVDLAFVFHARPIARSELRHVLEVCDHELRVTIPIRDGARLLRRPTRRTIAKQVVPTFAVLNDLVRKPVAFDIYHEPERSGLVDCQTIGVVRHRPRERGLEGEMAGKTTVDPVGPPRIDERVADLDIRKNQRLDLGVAGRPR